MAKSFFKSAMSRLMSVVEDDEDNEDAERQVFEDLARDAAAAKQGKVPGEERAPAFNPEDSNRASTETTSPAADKPQTGPAEAKPAAEPEAAAPSAKPAAGGFNLKALESNVQRLVKLRGEVLASKLRVVRFDELAAPLKGEARSGFLEAVDGIIRGYVSNDDSLRMVEGGACLIVFGKTNDPDTVCRAIRDDIATLVAADAALTGRASVVAAVSQAKGPVQLREVALDPEPAAEPEVVAAPDPAPEEETEANPITPPQPLKAKEAVPPTSLDLTPLYQQLEEEAHASAGEAWDDTAEQPVAELALSESVQAEARENWSADETQSVSAEDLGDWDDWLTVDWDQVREEMLSPTSAGGGTTQKQPGEPAGNDVPTSADRDDGEGETNWSYFRFNENESVEEQIDRMEAEQVSVEELRRQVNRVKAVARPVWDLETKKASAISCVPTSNVEGEAFTVGDDMVSENPMGVVTLGHDRVGVHWAGENAGGLPVLVPIHFESLATMRNRHFLFTSFMALAPEARKAIISELMLPKDIYSAAVEDVTRLLSPFSGRVAACVQSDWRQFGVLQSLGIRLAGFSFGDNMLMTEAEGLATMEEFARNARQAGIETFVKDLPSRNMALAAGAVGIRYAYAQPKPDPDTPDGPLPFRLDDLY